MWVTIALEFIKGLLRDHKSFRALLLCLVALCLGGQIDIKNTISDSKIEIMNKVSKVEDKIDDSERDRKLVLKEYNASQREIEGRLSFLEASTGFKRWQRR